MEHLQLFGYILSPFAQRVRFALEASKINYDYKEIDLYAGKQKEAEFKQINSLGKVPVISFENQNINESMVILEFLENQFGNIFPQSNVRKAHQRIWAYYFDKKIADKLWGIWGLLKLQDRGSILKFANEIADEIRYFTKNSGLVDVITENSNSYFEPASNLTFIDFVIAPLILFLEISYQDVFQMPFYSVVNMDDDLKAFQKYSQNLIDSQPFQSITRNLKQLPSNEICSFLSKINRENDTFNYDLTLSQFMKIFTSSK